MKNAAGILAFLPLVAAHGFIKSPAPRMPGDAFKAACGDQPFYQQSSDINGNVQGIKQVVPQDLDASKCNLWLCKGFQFDDNKDNVQSYKLGEKIPFEINIAAPHTGYANVSVVKTSSDKMIGTPLIEFENYAANAGTDKNNTAISVTLPESLGGECTKAGDCVLQWFWDAPDIDQTYESCVDFTVGGGSGSAPAPAPSASAPAASSGAETPATSSPAASEEDDEDCDDEEETPATTAAAEKPAATTLQAVAISSAADSGAAQPTSAPVADDDEDCEDEEPVANDDDEDCEEDDEPVAQDGDDEECPAEEEGDYNDEY
jgi:predicted carbohydrate-binding protein with CBM5 and CBM33 domain